MQTFTTEQAMAASGASYRQIDYWVSLGYIPVATRGTGTPRRWTRDQVTKAATLTALVAAGMEPRQAAGIRGSTARVGPVTITLDTEQIERQIAEHLPAEGDADDPR